MSMLPITSLFKKKNELGMMHEDVFLDIIDAKNIGLGVGSADRIKASQGMAMGLVNPAMSTGQNLGFGLFRGEYRDVGISDPSGERPCNIYMIGYAHCQNFMSAVCNGIAGKFDMKVDGTTYHLAADYVNALKNKNDT